MLAFITEKNVSTSYKQNLLKGYSWYVKVNDFSFEKPRLYYESKLPRVPTRENILKVIAAASKNHATIFTLLMETGVMPYELSQVSRGDINLESRLISVRGYKRHRSQVFKLKAETSAILQNT